MATEQPWPPISIFHAIVHVLCIILVYSLSVYYLWWERYDPKTVDFMGKWHLTGYHGNRPTMTTNLNLPLNGASIMYHFGVSLVFLSLIIRKIWPQNCKFHENMTFDWLPWQQSNHDNQFEFFIQHCICYASFWCIPCLSFPYNKKDITLKLLISWKSDFWLVTMTTERPWQPIQTFH